MFPKNTFRAERRVIVNLGCGNKLMRGVINVDLFGNPDVRADIREWRPRELASEVLAIHVVEHLPRADVLPFLKHVHSYIAPGGRVVVEMPDRLKCCDLLASPMSWHRGVLGLMGDRVTEAGISAEFAAWRESQRVELARLAAVADFASINALVPERFRLPGQAHEFVWTSREFSAVMREAGFHETWVSDPVFHNARCYRDTRWVGLRP